MPNKPELQDVVHIVTGRIEAIVSRGEVKTHELVQQVTDDELYPWSNEPLLALYQKQFITQAALCELYFDYASGDTHELVFGPISVRVEKKMSAAGRPQSSSRALSGAHYHPNVAFYLDYQNFYSATSESVQKLLDSFWQKYDAFLNQSSALEILELEEGADWAAIKQSYRRLAAQHHPDKGGDKARFIAVRQAFESLKVDGYDGHSM